MAWGSQGEVFMGDQMVSTKEYSDQMAHVIDAEVSRILHDAELLQREKRGTQVFYQVKESAVYKLCELVCDKLNRDAQVKTPFDFSI